MAAGYDTRAYRFAPPDGSINFFEVDLPEASARKQRLVHKLSMVPEGVSGCLLRKGGSGCLEGEAQGGCVCAMAAVF